MLPLPARLERISVGAVIYAGTAVVGGSLMALTLRILGRYLYLHWYVILPVDSNQPIGIAIPDQIRRRVYDALASEFRYLALDISFTKDAQWAHTSMPSEARPTSGTSGQEVS